MSVQWIVCIAVLWPLTVVMAFVLGHYFTTCIPPGHPDYGRSGT